MYVRAFFDKILDELQTRSMILSPTNQRRKKMGVTDCPRDDKIRLLLGLRVC